MELRSASLVLTCVVVFSGGASAQTCLHDASETSPERQRRTEALSALGVIQAAEASLRQFVPVSQLADLPAVRAMRSDGGALGDAARAINWRREEILPGWRVRLVLGDRSYAIFLRDARDPCGFTYSSDEGGPVVQGYPILRGPTPTLPSARE